MAVQREAVLGQMYAEAGISPAYDATSAASPQQALGSVGGGMMPLAGAAGLHDVAQSFASLADELQQTDDEVGRVEEELRDAALSAGRGGAYQQLLASHRCDACRCRHALLPSDWACSLEYAFS